MEPLHLDAGFFRRAHDALARETGRGRLYDAQSWDAVCREFLTETYDLWKDRDGTADTFLKMRLSLIELLFRSAEERAREISASAPEATRVITRSVDELNSRLRHARVELHYHNGLLQSARDELMEARTAEPCWAVLRDARWDAVRTAGVGGHRPADQPSAGSPAIRHRRPGRAGITDVGGDGAHVAAAVAVAVHHDAPQRALALDLVRPIGLDDLGQRTQRNEVGAGGDQEVVKSRGRAILLGQPDHHVEAAVAVNDQDNV